MEAKVYEDPSSDYDAEIVAAAQRDPAQYLALYERYSHQIYRYIRMRVHHEQVAEDITSQVFLTALSRLGTLRPDGNFAAWLFRVAHNAVQDFYRARKPEPALQEDLESLPDRDPGPEARTLAGEDAMALRAMIGSLRPEQQDVLALRFGAGLSAAEIGIMLGKSPEAIRVVVHRAIKELRLRYRNV